MQRGWNHDRHRHINAIGRQVLKEYDMEYHLDHTLPRANVMHFNFYENTVHNPVIGQSIGEVESLVIEIDDLVLKQPPQRFEVEDARDQERLRLLLGYDSEYQFPPGAYSNVGFSRNHADPDQEAFPANNRPPSYQPPGGV